MITINRIAVHEVIKESQYNEAETFITTTCLGLNDTILKFVEKLHDSYKSDNVVYAIFDQSEDRFFPKKFSEYNLNKTNSEFIQFTQHVTKNLRNKIVAVTLAKGGFIVYVDYSNVGTSFVGVFFIRDTAGVMFDKNEETHKLEINPVTYMNTDKLVMACRINMEKYIAQEGKYLTFLRRGQAEISEYFFDWICSIQPESSKEFTENLYNMVNEMPLPLNQETNKPIDINIFRQNLVTYIREKNRHVDLRDLGNHFYGDENAFTEFRDENSIELDNEFKADASTLRKFNLIDIKAEGIQLKFSRGLLNSGKIKLGTGQQVIIRSKELQDQLSKEINS